MTQLPTFVPYLAGTSVETGDRRILRSPYDGSPLCQVDFCGEKELDAALAKACAALALTRVLPSEIRASICAAVADGLRQKRELFANCLCDESGKPLSEAFAEVDRAVHTFELAEKEAASAFAGEQIPLDLRPPGYGRMGITRRVPIGVVVAITPFNFPLNLVAHKVAPALACGCPIVLKPAEQTPLSSLHLASLIAQTPWPKEALSVLPADRGVAEKLVTDPRPAALSFTGSAPVGWALKAKAGKKRVLLELGGNAAVILDESLESPEEIPGLMDKLIYGAFSYAGQKCISVQRIYVVDPKGDRFQRFAQRLAQAASALPVGDPRAKGVICGPMIDERNAIRVIEWVHEARALGATLLCGGERKGAVVTPTVLSGVPRGTRLYQEEAFGPICHVERVSTFAEALQAVNDSPYGLQASLFTKDLRNAMLAWDELEVGALILNEAPSFRVDHMPYGGVKDSGMGREGVKDTIRELTETRLLVSGSL